MSFSISWDETSPIDHTKFKAQPGHVRDLKTAIRERLQFGGMYFPSTDNALAGEYSYLRCATQGAKPTAVSGKGFVYCKTVSGIPELFFEDQNGTETQITSGGTLNATDSVLAKTGDWMLSSVTTARTGWTNVSATYSNKFVRINATALSTGGADTHTHSAGSYAVSGTTSTETGTGAAGSGVSGGTHSHTYSGSVSGSSASGDNVPAYVTAVIFQKN